MASGKDTQSQNLPTVIEFDHPYSSEVIAIVWRIGRDSRRQWYDRLRRIAKTESAVKVNGSHFILTGQAAFDSLS